MNGWNPKLNSKYQRPDSHSPLVSCIYLVLLWLSHVKKSFTYLKFTSSNRLDEAEVAECGILFLLGLWCVNMYRHRYDVHTQPQQYKNHSPQAQLRANRGVQTGLHVCFCPFCGSLKIHTQPNTHQAILSTCPVGDTVHAPVFIITNNTIQPTQGITHKQTWLDMTNCYLERIQMMYCGVGFPGAWLPTSTDKTHMQSSPLRPCKFYFLQRPYQIFQSQITIQLHHPNTHQHVSLTCFLSREIHLESMEPRVRLGTMWLRTFARKTCKQRKNKTPRVCQFIFTHQHLPNECFYLSLLFFSPSDLCYKEIQLWTFGVYAVEFPCLHAVCFYCMFISVQSSHFFLLKHANHLKNKSLLLPCRFFQCWSWQLDTIVSVIR